MAGRRLSAIGYKAAPLWALPFALFVTPILVACSSSPTSTTPPTINGAVKVNGVALHYEITGQGEPLILIEGLGTATWLWWKQVPELSRRFRVVAYDLRGSGWSDKPDEPYSIPMFADDLARLMDALRIKQAHVLGISLGGYVAQEFAIRYPHKVKRLILCSTSTNGPHAIPPNPDVIVALMTPVAGKDDLRDRIVLSLSPGYAAAHPSDVEQMLAWRLDNPQPTYAYNRQLMSAVGWTSEGRLGEITMPTLVLAGSEDRVVPPQNADVLVAGIPHAEKVILQGAGHLINVEQPETFNKEVIRFLTWK